MDNTKKKRSAEAPEKPSEKPPVPPLKMLSYKFDPEDYMKRLETTGEAFTVNIAEMLTQFLEEVERTKLVVEFPNFNCAALLLQGCSDVYSKKVESLFQSAEKLHDMIMQERSEEGAKPDVEKKSTRKARVKKTDVFELFPSLNLELREDLSCLNRAGKGMRERYPVPNEVLIYNKDDVGEVIYDRTGAVIGNKGDFPLNRSIYVGDGFFLLPTVSCSIVPPPEEEDEDLRNRTFRSTRGNQEFKGISRLGEKKQSTAPEKIDKKITETADKKITEKADKEQNTGARKKERDASKKKQPSKKKDDVLTMCPELNDHDILACIHVTADLLKRKKIGKKNTRCLPDKLKSDVPLPEDSVLDFCRRQFFNRPDPPGESLLDFDTPLFSQNSKMRKNLAFNINVLRTGRNDIMPIEDKIKKERKVREVRKDADDNDVTLFKPFDDRDIRVYHKPLIQRMTDIAALPEIEYDMIPSDPIPPPEKFCGIAEAEHENSHIAEAEHENSHIAEAEHENSHIAEAEHENSCIAEAEHEKNMKEKQSVPGKISHMTDAEHAEHEKFTKEMELFVSDPEVTRRYQEWQSQLMPFLNKLEERGDFDIDQCGQELIDKFDDNNSKQTKTFRDLCKGRPEKWQIHRSFMALLPLANLGNVELDKEEKPDGTEEVFVTLKSRKMHHKDIENFGHKEGEHP